jgi:hypothetical protein
VPTLKLGASKREHSLYLREQLARTRTLHEQRVSDTTHQHERQCLVEWQSRRLAETYADLASQPRYRLAVEFFMQELYGPRDFSKRDHDLERVSPIIVRVLPAKVVHTVGRAVELNALSQELDNLLLDQLVKEGCDFDHIDTASYASAYRNCNNLSLRQLQITLTRELGEDLDRVVRKPLIRKALIMMRPAAELAGFAELQDFLELGFAAFQSMNGATGFLDTVIGRETEILQRIFGRHPSPFALA